jgi:hypothetical protein
MVQQREGGSRGLRRAWWVSATVATASSNYIRSGTDEEFGVKFGWL